MFEAQQFCSHYGMYKGFECSKIIEKCIEHAIENRG
jgi:hypothetical protein